MIFHKAAVFIWFPLRKWYVVSMGYPQCMVDVFRGVKHFDDVFASSWAVSQGSLSTDGKIGTLTISASYNFASMSKSWSFNTSTHRYVIIKCTELTGSSWKFEAKLAGSVKSSKTFVDTGIKTVDLQNDGVGSPPYLGDIDEIVLTVNGSEAQHVKFDYVKICEKTMLTPSDDLDVVNLNVHLAVTEEVGSVNCLIQNYDAKYTDQINVGDLIEVAMSRTGQPLIKVFKGRINSVAKRAEATPRGPQHYLRLRGLDLGAELFNRLVTKEYENKEGSEIIKDVLANYTSLESVGVEVTTSTYVNEEYENKPAWEIIKYIAETAKDAGGVIGYDFKCEEGDIKFFPRDKYAGAVSLDGIITLCEHETAIERVRNKIYVYGEASKPCPLDRDTWTESLTPADGVWTSWSTLSLDSSDKVMGSYSIKTSGGTATVLVFTLNAGKEVNCNLYPSLTFQLKPAFGYPYFTIQLEDTAGMIVRRHLQIPDGEWSLQSFPAGKRNSDQWEHSVFNTQPFDWENVKKLSFYISTTVGVDFRVDNLFFNKSRWSGVEEDSVSQSKYGLRELAITDETLVSDDACSKVAAAELNYRKSPAEFLKVAVIGDPNIVAGETIHVVSSNENIDGDYRIQLVDHHMDDEGEFESLLTLIAEPPRLAEIISETRRELGVLTRGTAYRKLGR